MDFLSRPKLYSISDDDEIIDASASTRKRGEARARRDAGFRAAVKAYRKPYVEPPPGKTRPAGSMHRRAGHPT